MPQPGLSTARPGRLVEMNDQAAGVGFSGLTWSGHGARGHCSNNLNGQGIISRLLMSHNLTKPPSTKAHGGNEETAHAPSNGRRDRTDDRATQSATQNDGLFSSDETDCRATTRWRGPLTDERALEPESYGNAKVVRMQNSCLRGRHHPLKLVASCLQISQVRVLVANVERKILFSE